MEGPFVPIGTPGEIGQNRPSAILRSATRRRFAPPPKSHAICRTQRVALHSSISPGEKKPGP